jgi:NAD(P)-dependent dehydrogenase (short-subunit alcohol dehydrogenase family)
VDLGLKDRSVLVTGASQGIGRAIAETFAGEGCRLHIAARRADVLRTVQEEISGRHGVDVTIHAVDLSERGVAESLAERCADADIVVNNAGATPRGDVLQVDEDAWRSGWDLKVFGYINMTRAFYRRMVERRRGVIVNIIGIGAEKLEYAYAAGASGNGALVAFTRAVGSVSLDYGVRVVGVSPGWVETPRGVRSLRTRASEVLGDPDRWRELIAGWPAGRLLKPEEIADVVAFVASDRASAMTGHIVTVDGGFAARSYPQTAPSALGVPAPSEGAR